MPADASDENTSVYIGNQFLPDVDEVDPEAGTLKVHLGDMARTGAFTVNISGTEGRESATSGGTFTVEGDHRGKPIVSTMNPRSAKRGGTVTLRGTDLDGMHVVTVGGKFCNITSQGPKAISFTVAATVGLGKGQTVQIKSVDGPPIKCPFLLEVKAQ
jgi:hypothetical protein